MQQPSWRHAAACRNADDIEPDDFFGDGRIPNRLRELCDSCPVLDECFRETVWWEVVTYPVTLPQGFVAGMAGEARGKMYRQHGLNRHHTPDDEIEDKVRRFLDGGRVSAAA